MLTSVYLKTLHDLRGLILSWGIGLVAVAAINVILFPTFQQLPDMMGFLKNLPPSFKSLLGDLDAVLTVDGFLKLKLFDTLPMFLSIFGISQGARTLTGELEYKTCDLLLSQPIRRWRIVAEKYLAVITGLALVALLMAAGLVISCAAVGAEANTKYIIVATLNGLPLSFLFTALAVLGSCALASSRRAAVLAGSVMMGFYISETLLMIRPDLAGWRAVSLFAHHRDGVDFSGHLSVTPFVVFLAVSVALVAVGAVVFERRNLGD